MLLYKSSTTQHEFWWQKPYALNAQTEINIGLVNFLFFLNLTSCHFLALVLNTGLYDLELWLNAIYKLCIIMTWYYDLEPSILL